MLSDFERKILKNMKFRDILPWKVELEKQHGPQPTSTPRPFKFTKRKDSKRVNKLDISIFNQHIRLYIYIYT